MTVSDSALFDRGLDSLRASIRLGATGASDSRVEELPGVLAGVTPTAPDRSVVNSVVANDAESLAGSLDALARIYDDAGVRAWTVWVPERDRESVAVLETAGHVLDAAPRAMGLSLEDDLVPEAPPEPPWSGEWDLASAGLVNDRAYGDPDGMWGLVLGDLSPDAAHLYLTHLDGEPASFVMVHDHDGDCAFWFAATAPTGRRRGFVSGLLHRALRDARDRGCTTSTTQATAMGAPVYARIGYRDLGALQMWERRSVVSAA